MVRLHSVKLLQILAEDIRVAPTVTIKATGTGAALQTVILTHKGRVTAVTVLKSGAQ